MKDPAAIRELWRACDFNGNGKCSLAEVDKMIVERFLCLTASLLDACISADDVKDRRRAEMTGWKNTNFVRFCATYFLQQALARLQPDRLWS